MSDAVNLAHRVEELTKPFSCSIAFTSDSLEELPASMAVKVRSLADLQVRVKSLPVKVHELIDADGGDGPGDAEGLAARLATPEQFEQGVEDFLAGRRLGRGATAAACTASRSRRWIQVLPLLNAFGRAVLGAGVVTSGLHMFLCLQLGSGISRVMSGLWSQPDVGIGVAVIGAGLVGRWHAHYARQNGADILAIVDHDVAAASRLARMHGAMAFGHTTEMLASASPSVIHICTPLPSHPSIALEALAHGAHVIVEKPFADTAETARLVLDYARERRLLAVPVHQFACQRGIRQVLKNLSALGEPLRLKFRISSAGGEAMDPAGRDALLVDILPHPLSVLQRLWPGAEASLEDWRVLKFRTGELDVCGRWGGAALHGLLTTWLPRNSSQHLPVKTTQLPHVGEQGESPFVMV